MDEERTDDMSTALQLQQFMDEWYYRILHSGMANVIDREQAAIYAMDLFQVQGVPLSREDKEDLSKKDDDDMIEGVVQKMSEENRKAFSHFALQLQLVMSAASRVRCVLEEGSPEEVARIMEDGDAGVTTQILKQTIVEASIEVAEVKERHLSWLYSTNKRLVRMSRTQRELEYNRRELERMNIKLEGFAKEQNAKARQVLMSMAGNSDKVLVRSVYNCWVAWFRRYQAERDIHDKFQKEIDDAQKKLMELRAGNAANVCQMLQRKSQGSEKLLLAECTRVWALHIQDEREERELAGQYAAARQKIGNLKEAQKENAKRSMMRICQGNDQSLTLLCFQEWVKSTEESRREKAFNEQVRTTQAKMQEFLKGKNDQATGVLSRMAGSSDTGLLHTTFSAWAEDLKAVKKAKEMEAIISSSNAKFANLNSRVKANASSSTVRASELDADNAIMLIFMNWATEARLNRLVRHYAGQMDSKKQQLEAVQNMFKNFATQLEQGLGSTPRTTRKSTRSSSRPHKEGKEKDAEAHSRPPVLGHAPVPA